METIVLILALGVPVSMLATAAAFWFIFKSSQRHNLDLLDRFLSRNMSEYGMTDLVRREIEVDQTQESDEDADDAALTEYLRKRSEAQDMVS